MSDFGEVPVLVDVYAEKMIFDVEDAEEGKTKSREAWDWVDIMVSVLTRRVWRGECL